MTPTLAATLWSPTRSPAVRFAALSLIGSALLAISAKTNVWIGPVPLTMQTYVVLVLGAAFGWRLAAATVALYLAEGLAGLPVFAGAAAGPAYMMGPTAGFLAGFLAAAVFVGYLAEKGYDRSLPRMVAAMAAGHAIIFAFGWTWLSVLVGPEKAFAVGVAPFYAATIIKTVLAGVTLPAAWTLLRR